MLRFDDVAWGRLIVVDLGARLGDGFHHGGVTGHVLGNVLNDGKGRHHAQLFIRQRVLTDQGGAEQQAGERKRA